MESIRREGTNLRFTFHYFNFNGEEPVIKELQVSVSITEFRDGTPVFEFKMMYDTEGIMSPFPEEHIRKIAILLPMQRHI